MEGVQIKEVKQILEPELESVLEAVSQQFLDSSSVQVKLFMTNMRNNAVDILNNRYVEEKSEKQRISGLISETENALHMLGGLPSSGPERG